MQQAERPKMPVAFCFLLCVYFFIFVFGEVRFLLLRAILNKSWRQHPTRHQLYGHLPHITKTIQARRTRHAGHCWRSKDELISDVLLWTPTYGQTKAGRPARTYLQQLCEDTGCSPEDLPEAMNAREKWRERVRDIRTSGTTWWWWWWWWYFCAVDSCEFYFSHGRIDYEWFLNISIWPKYGNLQVQLLRVRMTKDNPFSHIPKTGPSPSDIVQCHTKDSSF